METEKRALPFETEMGFSSIPNAVSKYYVRHPLYNPSAERLYRYLLSRHNDNYGYAWPSWTAMVRETGLATGTIKTCLNSLEHLGLINRESHVNEGTFDNKIYTFNLPIEDEDKFNDRFGEEIADILSKRKKKGGARNTSPKKNILQDKDNSSAPNSQSVDTSWL